MDCRSAAMLIKSALRDWLSVSYVTQYPVPPIFSFPLEGKSREAGKGVRGRAPIGCSIAVLTANRRPPERSDATFLHNPWHPSGQRPGGAINPHARKGVSTFGNTGKHRLSPDPDRAERRLNPPTLEHTLSRPHISHISHIKSRHRNACFSLKERWFSIKRKEPTCRL